MPDTPLAKLFYGRDAGHYTLPDELVKARDTYVTVMDMPFPAPPLNAWETIQATAVATVEAVHAGTQLPDPSVIEAARAAERVYQDALDMMDLCRRTATDRIHSTLRMIELITDHLAPAHDETWQTFQAAHRLLTEYGETANRRLLTAPARIRKAADTVDTAAERYDAVRAARAVLTVRGARCPQDPDNKYGAIRNFHEVHPTRMAMVRTAWHGMSTRQYLAWMVDHGGQLWMPTPDQQAEAVEAEAGLCQPFKSRA